MVVGVSETSAICQQEWPFFLRSYDLIPLSIMWKEEERHILPAGCVSAP